MTIITDVETNIKDYNYELLEDGSWFTDSIYQITFCGENNEKIEIFSRVRSIYKNRCGIRTEIFLN